MVTKTYQWLPRGIDGYQGGIDGSIHG
jgi:hypothetical protein